MMKSQPLYCDISSKTHPLFHYTRNDSIKLFHPKCYLLHYGIRRKIFFFLQNIKQYAYVNHVPRTPETENNMMKVRHIFFSWCCFIFLKVTAFDISQ